MKTNRFLGLLLLLSIALMVLPGCGGRSNHAIPPSGGSGQTDFTQFVKDQINSTSNTADPMDINNLDFQFSEDPSAFDDILQ